MKTKLIILALVSSSSAFAITSNYSDSSVNSESESSLFSSSSDYKQNRPALAKMSIQKLMQAPEARTYQGEFVMLRDVLKVAKSKLGDAYNEDTVLRYIIKDHKRSLESQN